MAKPDNLSLMPRIHHGGRERTDSLPPVVRHNGSECTPAPPTHTQMSKNKVESTDFVQYLLTGAEAAKLCSDLVVLRERWESNCEENFRSLESGESCSSKAVG